MMPENMTGIMICSNIVYSVGRWQYTSLYPIIFEQHTLVMSLYVSSNFKGHDTEAEINQSPRSMMNRVEIESLVKDSRYLHSFS